eukprot:2392492-Prymnesium_polylepis.1
MNGSFNIRTRQGGMQCRDVIEGQLQRSCHAMTSLSVASYTTDDDQFWPQLLQDEDGAGEDPRMSRQCSGPESLPDSEELVSALRLGVDLWDRPARRARHVVDRYNE